MRLKDFWFLILNVLINISVFKRTFQNRCTTSFQRVQFYVANILRSLWIAFVWIVQTRSKMRRYDLFYISIHYEYNICHGLKKITIKNICFFIYTRLILIIYLVASSIYGKDVAVSSKYVVYNFLWQISNRK